MIRPWIPFCALALLTGCVDKDVREYAAKLSDLLGTYQKQIEKRIQTEQTFYKKSAEDFREEADLEAHRSMALERNERARELLAEIREKGRAPASATLQQRLRDYANTDFDATRRLLERETSAEAEYLAGIQDLDGQAKTVKALNKALQDLAKAPSTTGQLKQLQEFVTGVKTEIDRLDCADLKKALDQSTAAKQRLEAKKKALDDAPPEEKEKNKLEIDKLTKQIATQDGTIAGLTSQRKERGCTD